MTGEDESALALEGRPLRARLRQLREDMIAEMVACNTFGLHDRASAFDDGVRMLNAAIFDIATEEPANGS